MGDDRDLIAAWIAREILPHEGTVRHWLSRRWRHGIDVDDVIQEAYCRLARLSSVSHIDNPAGYFHQTVRAVVTDALRRSQIIDFVQLTEDEWFNVKDNEPQADRAVQAGQELERVRGLLSLLPETCRKAIELRRIEGLSQRETAERLGVSESVIENHLVRGLRKVLKALAAQDAETDGNEQQNVEQKDGVSGKPWPHRKRG